MSAATCGTIVPRFRGLIGRSSGLRLLRHQGRRRGRRDNDRRQIAGRGGGDQRAGAGGVQARPADRQTTARRAVAAELNVADGIGDSRTTRGFGVRHAVVVL